MRLRFLAAAGPGEELDRLSPELASHGNPPLRKILGARGLSFWTLEGTPCALAPDGSAAAAGLLFERSTGARREQLPSPLPSAETFVARFWGAYILAGCVPSGGHFVLRDPSGAVSAYHVRRGAIDLYASDVDLLRAAAPAILQPDLEFVRQRLTFPFLRTARTGAVGIREVLPGTSHHRAFGSATETIVWSPWNHARPELAIGDFDAAASRLREEILHAVPRLADGAGDIVVQLSGGLDSSLVAASLAAAGRPFRAVTFATRAPDGDERAYARQLAQHFSIDLAELVEGDALPDFEHIPPMALRPPPNALLQPLHRALSLHLALTGGDLVLDGTGGDNVFCYLNSASPALDAFRRQGVAGGLAALQDLARLHGTTFWTVARAALRRSRRRPTPWRRDETFLAAGAAAAEPDPHPWLERPRWSDRGTFEQVQSIVGIRHFLGDPTPGAAAGLHPLLAQPVMEACLTVPSWLWARGGQDRAVARAAFRGLLPDAILSRRSKGRLESMFIKGYMSGRGRLETLLLDGRLAAAGLLDRAAVLDYLRRPDQPGDSGYIRLLELSSAETWLRSFPG